VPYWYQTWNIRLLGDFGRKKVRAIKSIGL
jgi:hypothetical protein